MHQHPLTDEQLAIVGNSAPRLAVSAFAGTGKTTTAAAYTWARPNRRFLYLVFNTSAKLDADGRFPEWVHVSTIHALARAALPATLKAKVCERLNTSDVRQALPMLASVPFAMIRHILRGLNVFFQSADKHLMKSHFDKVLPCQLKPRAEAFAKLGAALWGSMIDPDSPVGLPHDAYLKWYHLSNPDLSDRFDHIILDEAQDSNPVTEAVVLAQTLPILMIGDAHQAIYGFRGAVDALSRFSATAHLKLTHSFRFGPVVGAMASWLLERFKNDPTPVVGAGRPTLVTYSTEHAPAARPVAFLQRSFSGCLDRAIEAIANEDDIAWVGGVEAYPLDDLWDVYHMMADKGSQIRNPALKREFKDYADYRSVAVSSGDAHMVRLVRLVEMHTHSVPAIVDKLKTSAVALEDATVILTTAHRSKGLEFEHVVIGDDFQALTMHTPAEEINLLYVAITRGRSSLTVPSKLGLPILASNPDMASV